MSILVSGLRLPIESDDYEAVLIALDRIGVPKGAVSSSGIYKRSFDARHGRITKIVSVVLDIPQMEESILASFSGKDVRKKAELKEIKPTGKKVLSSPPVVIGFGPAGIFAGLILAKNGYCPLILERGPDIDRRDQAVLRFFEGGPLDESANVQFGEGGAGAYSDGKLTTRISDERCEAVLHEFRRHGAPEEILKNAKPHIGTDLLKNIIKSMRREIMQCGGEIRFDSEALDLIAGRERLTAVKTREEAIPCDVAVLAVGHSARTSYKMLLNRGVLLKSKAFAVGMRIEHPQEMIDRAMYGKYAGHPLLPHAEYFLTNTKPGRGCYSFCMCPGGTVVAASSEENTVVVNGMSLHARDGKNANSALVVSVTPDDFSMSGALEGVSFQQTIEQAAFRMAGETYEAPAQLVRDYLAGNPTKKDGGITPTYPRGVRYGSLDPLFPDFINDTLRRSLFEFDKKIKGFASSDAVLTAPETRTSSPIRIVRDSDTLQSVSLPGLFPCGEGAGYAGGIMSAAVDGMRVAERIMEEYKPIKSAE